MKKKILGILILSIFFFTGCGAKNDDIIQKLKDKVKKLDSYQINGLLEVTNNETTYKYDINVAYKKNELYRVSLKNKTNNHEQIILKNQDGVYVLTPALNKSFKFQSEWPYSNSQSYLYQTIINDIENDDNVKIDPKKDGYIITTKVNYSNNKDLVNQKIYLDKNANINKVEVMDKSGIVKIRMKYQKVTNNKDFDNNYFELSSNIDINKLNDEKNNNQQNDEEKEKTASKLFDISYPLYIPDNTKLTSQDTTELGRTILTFAGDKSFVIIEEASSLNDDYETISVNGELEFVNDVIGTISDGTVSWTSNGVEYYAASDSMDTTELLEVVNSMNTVTVGK